jgi:hypothetical protein
MAQLKNSNQSHSTTIHCSKPNNINNNNSNSKNKNNYNDNNYVFTQQIGVDYSEILERFEKIAFTDTLKSSES